MEKEDPIARAERLQAKKKGNAATVVLAVVAGVLAIALAVIATRDYRMVKDLEQDKADLQERITVLKTDFDNLTSDYDEINKQLDSSREEVAILIDRIKRTEATNRQKMRAYEKELGTLRSIMKSYIVQIDSLNSANLRLSTELNNSRQQLAEAKGQNKELASKVNDLSSKVATGSVVKARGIAVEAYNASDKKTDRSSRVKRLAVSLSLVENDLAPKGPMTVYVRALDPDGNLIVDGTNASFYFEGAALEASASREVDYEGEEVDMIIYVNDVPEYTKGVYTVEVFTAKSRLGSAELVLR